MGFLFLLLHLPTPSRLLCIILYIYSLLFGEIIQRSSDPLYYPLYLYSRPGNLISVAHVQAFRKILMALEIVQLLILHHFCNQTQTWRQFASRLTVDFQGNHTAAAVFSALWFHVWLQMLPVVPTVKASALSQKYDELIQR